MILVAGAREQTSRQKTLGDVAKMKSQTLASPKVIQPPDKVKRIIIFLLAISATLIWMVPFQRLEPVPFSAIKTNVSNVINTLSAFQSIAFKNGGSRSVVHGHKASANYIVKQLETFNNTFEIVQQEVFVPVQVDDAPPSLSFTSLGEFTSYEPRLQIATVQGSGSCWLEEARVFMISDCNLRKMPKKQGDWIALIDASRSSSSCSHCDRMTTAIRLGATGVVFLSTPGNQQGYPHPLPPRHGVCGRYPKYVEVMNNVGIVGLSDDAAWDFLSKFAGNPKLKATLKVMSAYRDYPTRNIIATSVAGNASDIVMFGSHLDGVPAGPGINDDGSGAAATLELARAFAASPLATTTIPKLRFAWWTAEEIGLLGSKFYVQNLTDHAPEELAAFRLNIDTDMIASPNWVRGVWSGADLQEPLRSKTRVISDLINNLFSKQGLPTFEFKFNGRSDFQPFLDAGVPCGGIITGEDEIKSIESEKLFGGVAGMVLDPCYHQDCDRVENLVGSGMVILEQNLNALTYLLDTFATRSTLA